MSNPLRIAAVSYANTFPFVYGIENSGLLDNYKLILLPPAQCAGNFLSGESDIALIPAGALPSLTDYKIITDFCIGAVNEVKTVLLLSNKKIPEIKTIGLDIESATSVRLVKIFARHYWNIKPEWQQMNVREFKKYPETDALVVIGDKAVELSKHFLHKTDLAAEWHRFTGLPFVFAVWVCRNNLHETYINKFSSAIQFGIENISEVVKKYKPLISSGLDLESYYRDNIDYRLDEFKKLSLQKFLNFITELD